MLFPFVGHDSTGTPCTTTTLDVTPISGDEYGDPEIENERSFFENGNVEFVRLNAEAIGLARNHGGQSEERGLYLHNRLFMDSENAIDHLQLTRTLNTAERLSLVRLPAGARLAIGYIAGGKGMQARISGPDISSAVYEQLAIKSLQPAEPFGPSD